MTQRESPDIERSPARPPDSADVALGLAFTHLSSPRVDDVEVPTGPALEALFDLFERNYRALRQLLPDVHERPCGSRFAGRATSAPTLYVSIEDQSPYTTTLRLTHRFGSHGTRQPDLLVRVFHDARQAEVLERFCRNADGHVLATDLPDQRSLFCRLQHSRFLERWLELLTSRRYAFDVAGVQVSHGRTRAEGPAAGGAESVDSSA